VLAGNNAAAGASGVSKVIACFISGVIVCLGVYFLDGPAWAAYGFAVLQIHVTLGYLK
jgi:hypothetical protein